MLDNVDTISVIGCGGTGSWLLAPLLRFLNAQCFGGEVQVWDGDRYSLENLGRQDAAESHIGRFKAECQVERYRTDFQNLRLWNRNEFVTARNVADAVHDASAVLVCVDNHPARVLIARQAEELRDVCLISAGNERLDGNVCVTLRRHGRNLTASLLERHPEITAVTQGDRSQMGCEELAAAGDMQLLITNFLAAASMIAAFHRLWTLGKENGPRRKGRTLPQEIFFDADQCCMTMVPAER